MKKILVIIVLSIALISNIKLDRTSIKKEEETRAIFVSYIELNKYIKGNNYEISKRNIRKIIKNIKMPQILIKKCYFFPKMDFF